jgi:hypothetical protein
MIRNAVIIGLGATLLAACVPVQQRGPNPPSGPEPQAEATTAPAEPAEGKPLAPVDVRKLTCATLNSSSDDDKAYATSFLLGYRSALIHSHTIEIKRIEALEEAALADCTTKPDALATKIFAAALQRIGPGGQLREAPRPHHREPRQAMPGQMAPEQQPPAPAHEPPIQYTPAQTPPTPMAPTQAAPAQAPPTQGTPHEATPAQPGPTQATPTQPAPTPPTQFAPTMPTQAAPPPAEPSPAAPTPAPPAEPTPPPKPAPATGEQKQ